MIYSFYIYIKEKFFNKKQFVEPIDNNCCILNIGYLPNDELV
jgi:hypothetical protein